MSTLTYTFDQPNTTSGLGTVTGLPEMVVVSGAARITNQRPVFTTDRSQRPAAVADTGGNDADITITAGGGDAIYLRWVDDDNWVAARIRRYVETQTTWRTEYEWGCDYGFAPGSLSQFGGSSHKHFGGANGGPNRVWSASATSCPHPASYRHSHDVWDAGDMPFNISHTHNLTSCTRTGATRQVPTSYSVTRYQLIVEQSVNGAISNLGTVAIATPSTLRARVQGTTLQAFVNGSANAAVTTNTTVHRASTRHGFGRGPSEVDSTALDTVTINTLNDAPYAPTLESPTGAVDRTAPLRFRFTPRDPDPGDTMRGFEIGVRPEGATDWTTSQTVTSTNPFYDLAAGALTEGRWGWTVRTVDSGGRVGPWAPEQFFSAVTPSTTHTFTSPSPGQVITSNERLVEWSSDHDAYRLRVLSAAGEGTVGSTVYYDSGIVADPAAHSLVVPFPTNGIMVALELTVERGTLWSAPVTSFHPVSWLGPRAPVAVLNLDDPAGAITVDITDPIPFGDHPTVVGHNIERDTAVAVVEDTPIFVGNWEQLTLRPAQVVAANGSYTDWSVANGEHYRFRVEAIGANGTTTYSDEVSEEEVAPEDEPNTWPSFSEGFDALPKNDAPTSGFGVQPFGTSPFGGSS